MPHGQCYLWEQDLLWLHAIADSLISLAYFSIPLLLIYFIRQRQDVPFRRIFALFSLFIISCGLTHLMGVWTLWHPAYWVSGWLKVVTALVSLYTAVQLIPTVPKALSLPSPTALAEINQALAREIQERQEAERQIRQLNDRLQSQVDELERLNLLKDDFLSTVSHELRTPLTSIRLSVELLQMSLCQFSLTEKQQQYLALLQQECQREIELVEDLLMLQELETNTYIRSPEALNLAQRLTTWVQMLQERADSARQDLSLEILSPFPPLQLDVISLERILRELIVNACKHGDQPGSIQVQASLDPSPVTENGFYHLLLQVRNTGHIPPTELPYLFNSFYRVPQADPWKQGGTGLGLALVKKLVESMQGKITAKSEDGWVSFSLELPVAPSLETAVDISMNRR
ncbi:MAG: HAMP domain-containing sensor histidine kinase [Thermostichus sp. HHBFW_bins_43]